MYSIQENLFDTSEYEKSRDYIASDIDYNRLGVMAEISFSQIAASLNYAVFFPIGHTQKADLIVHKPPYRPKSVQIKKACMVSSLVWNIRPCMKHNKANGRIKTPYQVGDFDIFAAYISEINVWALYTIYDIAEKLSIQWHKHGSHRNNFEILDIE